jgi:spore germination protein GerM
MDKERTDSRHPWLLYGYLAITILSIILVVIALPNIKRAMEESQMIPLVRAYLEQSGDEANSQATTEVKFPIPETTGNGFSFGTYAMMVDNNASHNHRRVEALLKGPPVEALEEGAVTFIPKGTQLRGLTVSYRIAFVDLSKEFLNKTVWEDGSYELRRKQLKDTLLQNPDVRDVVILIGGKPLDEMVIN